MARGDDGRGDRRGRPASPPGMRRSGMPTVDFEAYLNETHADGKPFDVDTLLRMEDEAGIDVAVIMPANRSAAGENYAQPDNQRVADAIRGNRRCIGCATINPTLGVENTDRQILIMRENDFGGAKLMAVLHHYIIDD